MAQIILTNHVKQRAQERGVSLNELNKTVRFPDQVIQKKHIKSFGAYQVVVPIKRQGNSWITTSVWKNSNSNLPRKQFFLEKLV